MMLMEVTSNLRYGGPPEETFLAEIGRRFTREPIGPGWRENIPTRLMIIS
jgi:hypothetical protein